MGVQYFESAVRTPAAASGATIATLHTGANLRCYITEIGLGISAGTQTQVGIIRPNNTPVASTSQLGQALDPQSAASTVNLDSAWSTAPTIGSNVYLRRFQLPASAGAGFIWTWPESAPLVIAVSSWLVLWNFGGSSNAAADLYVKWFEGA